MKLKIFLNIIHMNKLFIGLLLIGTFSCKSCYQGSAFEDEDLDVAITLYDESANFSENKTFAMPDTVMGIGEGNLVLTGEYDDDVINQVRNKMTFLGYQEVTDFTTEDPDVVILLSKSTSTSIDVFTYSPIWWDSWGYYPVWPIYGPIGPGYAPYYPWGARTVQVYTSGTLIVEMLDADDLSMPERIPAIWAGAINGIYDRDDPQLGARISENIDHLFDQSPYLKVQ
jgi:hypothetical protein